MKSTAIKMKSAAIKNKIAAFKIKSTAVEIKSTAFETKCFKVTRRNNTAASAVEALDGLPVGRRNAGLNRGWVRSPGV